MPAVEITVRSCLWKKYVNLKLSHNSFPTESLMAFSCRMDCSTSRGCGWAGGALAAAAGTALSMTPGSSSSSGCGGWGRLKASNWSDMSPKSCKAWWPSSTSCSSSCSICSTTGGLGWSGSPSTSLSWSWSLSAPCLAFLFLFFLFGCSKSFSILGSRLFGTPAVAGKAPLASIIQMQVKSCR